MSTTSTTKTRSKTYIAVAVIIALIVGAVVAAVLLLQPKDETPVVAKTPVAEAVDYDAKWEALHAYMATLPAPDYACYEDPYAGTTNHDSFYYDAEPQIGEGSLYDNGYDCSYIVVEPVEDFSSLPVNEYGAKLREIGTAHGIATEWGEVKVNIATSPDGFSNTAEYVDSYFPLLATAHTATDVEADENGTTTEKNTVEEKGEASLATSEGKYFYALQLLSNAGVSYDE